jgi:hypothetical protein
MRLRWVALVVLASVLPTAGCYEATFPLDRMPQTDLSGSVIGSWRCLPADPSDTDEAVTLTVKRARDRVYDVTLEETNQEADRFEAHASLVNATPVINLKDRDPANDKPWVFLRTSLLRPDVLAIQVLSEAAVAKGDESAAGIRKLIEQSQGRVFEEAAVCVRVKAQ